MSFTVEDGEVVVLIGPSGCGKTTLLRIAVGLELTNSRRVLVDGREVRGCGYDRAIVFEHADPLPWLTVIENVMFGLEMKGVHGTALKESAMRALATVGLEQSWNPWPNQLSSGLQQRVGIARALAVDPKVLLMDEPFGVDSASRSRWACRWASSSAASALPRRHSASTSRRATRCR